MINDLHIQYLPQNTYIYDDETDIYIYNDDIQFSYIQNDNNITIIPQNISSLHLLWYIVKIITTKYNTLSTKYICDNKLIHHFMLELNEKYTKNKYNNISSRCLICTCKICNNESCKTRLFHTITDNTITNMYKSDSNLLMVLLNIFDASMNTSRNFVINPLPQFNIQDNNNVKSIIQYYKQNINSINNILDNIKNSSNDIELYNLIGYEKYGILKNALLNNYFSMNTKSYFEIKNKFTDMIDNNSISVIKINYSAEIEKDFPNQHYLYHGSSLDNWYSIIKNGLKDMVNTKFQTHDSFKEDVGIYFSDLCSYSYNYCGFVNKDTKYNKIENFNNKYNNYMKIMAVFEIKDNIEQYIYTKYKNEYLINDTSKILMRYLIVFNKDIVNYDNFKSIDDYFRNYLKLTNISNNINSIQQSNKRLNNELKQLKANTNIKSITTESETVWFIELNNNKNIKILLNKYPIIPPTLILIKDNNETKIELDDLIPSNWKLTSKLNNILNQLI